MRCVPTSSSSRRQFLQHSGALAAGTVLAGSLPAVHAAEDNTIRLALIGCGPRGSGAVRDALSVQGQGPVKLFAMADLQETKLNQSLTAIKKEFESQVDVSADRKFVGFDAYRKAIDVLRPGDIAMCTTRAYIRPAHVEYAVQKGINAFMEKPFASDPAGLHRLLKAGEAAEQKGVKIAAGLQCRHSPARQALIRQIRDGVMGDITVIRANRLGGTGWLNNQGEKANDLMSQMQFGKVQLYWLGSGHMVDYLIHQIDECCWIKDAWPVAAHGVGGRVANSRECGQNLDSYSIEYTFADGTKAMVTGRYLPKCHNEFATYVQGTKYAAQFCVWGASPILTRTYKDQRITADNIDWRSPAEVNPWQVEWNVLLDAIRTDRPHNEAQRAACADLASIMGRAAVHSGKVITWDEAMQSKFQFCPNVADLTADSPAPVHADAQGRYPAPIPGACTEI